jgi:hypothetical protein
LRTTCSSVILILNVVGIRVEAIFIFCYKYEKKGPHVEAHLIFI